MMDFHGNVLGKVLPRTELVTVQAEQRHALGHTNLPSPIDWLARWCIGYGHRCAASPATSCAFA